MGSRIELVPFEIGDPLEYMNKFEPKEIGALSFKREVSQLLRENQVQLSKEGNFKEAAQNLFAAMRYLDNLDLKIIVAELLPEEGLGRAINDRLRRAAVRE